MSFQNPQPSDFQTYFARNFPFNADPTLGVTQTDISNAMLTTNGAINMALFPSQDSYTPAYLNLTAHYLTLSLQASSGGGGNGFLEQSKSVGSISQSFAIPEAYLKNPLWAAFMTTPYGRAYLLAIMPYLTGQIFTVYSGARA